MINSLLLWMFKDYIKQQVEEQTNIALQRTTALKSIRKNRKVEAHLDKLLDSPVIVFHNSYRLIRAGILVSYVHHDGNFICTIQEFKSNAVFSTNSMPCYASPDIIKALIKLTPEEAYAFYLGCNQPISPVHKGNFNEVLWYSHLNNMLSAVIKFISQHTR